MKRRIFLLAGALPLVAAFGAIIFGLGLVVFNDNGSDSKVAQGSTSVPTSSVAAGDQAWLGVSGGSTPTGKGVGITEVVDDSPAKAAGISVGDVILKFEGTDVNAIDKLASLVRQRSPGDAVTLFVIKDGVAHADSAAKDIDVALATRPADSNPTPRSGPSQTGGGWLGTAGKTADSSGVEVTDVTGGSPADNAGIAKGDIIVSVDGEAMDSFRALASLIHTHSPGDTVTITFEHNGDKKDVEVTLVSRPASNLPDIGGRLPDLGGILDGFSLDRLIGGQLQYVDSNGNVVTLSADAGLITSISSDSISVHPPKGDDKTFDLTADAHVPSDLAEGDQVIVISKVGKVAAVIITDLSKLLPSGANDWFDKFFQNGNGNFDSNFLPDGLIPHCTIDQNGVNCELIATPTPAPQPNSNS